MSKITAKMVRWAMEKAETPEQECVLLDALCENFHGDEMIPMERLDPVYLKTLEKIAVNLPKRAGA